MKLEEIIATIISDLKLQGNEVDEFKNQFIQLFIYNLLLDVPDKLKLLVNDLFNTTTNYQNININIESLAGSFSKIGINPDEAKNLLDQSLRKSLTEVMGKYSNLISAESKQKLQDYLTEIE